MKHDKERRAVLAKAIIRAVEKQMANPRMTKSAREGIRTIQESRKSRKVRGYAASSSGLLETGNRVTRTTLRTQS